MRNGIQGVGSGGHCLCLNGLQCIGSRYLRRYNAHQILFQLHIPQLTCIVKPDFDPGGMHRFIVYCYRYGAAGRHRCLRLRDHGALSCLRPVGAGLCYAHTQQNQGNEQQCQGCTYSPIYNDNAILLPFPLLCQRKASTNVFFDYTPSLIRRKG